MCKTEISIYFSLTSYDEIVNLVNKDAVKAQTLFKSDLTQLLLAAT